MVLHCKYDPGAWALVGKWIEDGLADAKVLPSDRRNVYATGGRVLQTPEDGNALFASIGDGPPLKAGVLVELREEAPL